MYKKQTNLFPQIVLLTSSLIISGLAVTSLLRNTQTVNAAAPCIVTIFGQQYDVAPLQPTGAHSGGNIFTCGTDMTAAYQGMHGTDVSRITQYLVTTPTPSVSASPSPSSSPTPSSIPSISPSPTVSPTLAPSVSPSPSISKDDIDDDDFEEILNEVDSDHDIDDDDDVTIHHDIDSKETHKDKHTSPAISSNSQSSHDSQIKAGSREHHDD